jgi:hypothetical protein
VTNECTNKYLSYFINECGALLGISDKVENKRDPKAILSFVLKELVRFWEISSNPLD